MATVNPVVFIRQARSELSKVVWPNRSETVKLTAVVIGVSVGVGLFIGLLDVIFTKVVSVVIH